MKDTIHINSDINKDGHCDICGKFVDSNGSHGASFRNEITRFVLNDKYYGESYFYMFPLSDEEKTALFNYCTNDKDNILSSPNINGYLRSIQNYSFSDERSILNNVLLIDNVFIKNFNYQKMRVFRGFSVESIDKFNKIIRNDDIECLLDEAFLSTSSNYETATKYCLNNAYGNVHIFLDITINPFTKCMPIKKYEKLVTYTLDNEILFPRRTKIKIKYKNEIKNKNETLILMKGEI